MKLPAAANPFAGIVARIRDHPKMGTLIRFSLLAIVVALYMVTITSNIRNERRLILADIQRISDVTTVSAQKHTEAIFDFSVQQLTALRSDLTTDLREQRTAQQILEDHFYAPPYLRAMLLLDGQGVIRASTFKSVIGNDAHESRFFRVHLDDPDYDVFTGDIIVGDTTLAPHFFSSIGLHDAGGTFEGVIAAAYELTYFRDLYRQLVPSELYTIALFHAGEGMIVASDSEIRPGELPGSSQFPTNVPNDQSNNAERFRILSETGVRLQNTSAELTVTPFFVSTMADVDALLAPHRRASMIKYIFAALFLLTATGLVLAFEVHIANRRKAEAEKSTLEAELRHAQKMESLGTLAGGLAHDFNNLLSSIIGFGEVAKERAKGQDRLSRAINQILLAGRRAESIVDQILTFSRRTESSTKPVRVDHVIHEVVDLMKASIHPSIDIEVEVKATNCWAAGGEGQMDQVFMNICKNAVQAMNSGGLLKIRLDELVLEGGNRQRLKPGSYWRVQFTDSGEGIPKSRIDRIFDPYFTTKAPGKGMGLGLSIAHGIVTAHGGAIDVASKPGKGTTVTVFLPEASPGEEDRDMLAGGALNGGGRTVMIVDDEEAIVSLMEERLADYGFEPIGFVDSAKAWEAFQQSPQGFDLAILDYTMPGKDGIQLAKDFRSLRTDFDIILMTGFHTREIFSKASECHISNILKKPIRAHEIERVLGASL